MVCEGLEGFVRNLEGLKEVQQYVRIKYVLGGSGRTLEGLGVSGKVQGGEGLGGSIGIQEGSDRSKRMREFSLRKSGWIHEDPKGLEGSSWDYSVLDSPRSFSTGPDPSRTSKNFHTLPDPPKPFQTLQYPRHPSNPSKTLSNPSSTYPPPHTHTVVSPKTILDLPGPSMTLSNPPLLS